MDRTEAAALLRVAPKDVTVEDSPDGPVLHENVGALNERTWIVRGEPDAEGRTGLLLVDGTPPAAGWPVYAGPPAKKPAAKTHKGK